MNLQRMIVLFMDYCRSKQLRPKTMASYEQTLKLFSRWLKEKCDTLKVAVAKGMIKS